MSTTPNMKEKPSNRQTTTQLKIIFQNVNGKALALALSTIIVNTFFQNAPFSKTLS
jgi:hypothetical protein